MFVRVTYPKIQAFTSNGQFAAAYEIHTYVAGTSTAAVTYSERTLTIANTNPVILNSRGEADIYIGRALKLVFTEPGGDPAVPIWTVDYVGEMQANFVTGSATPVTANNNYAVTTTPAVSALSNNFHLIMTPDVSNTDTIGTNTFTGTGANDCVASGPYLGSTSGSIFSVQIDGALAAVPGAATLAENAVAGLVTIGNHSVKLTAVTAIGETTPGVASNIVAATGNMKLDVSNIPALAGQITGYNVYMNKAGGSIWYLVNDIPITVTAYTISIADATLGTGIHVAAPTDDSTGIGDTFKWKKDGGAWTTGVAITGAAQILIEGLTVTFAVISGHVYNDLWAIEVETPARVNLDTLGNLIVYKNKGGSVVALDGDDMKSGYPAQLILNEALNAWLLINPATPVFSTPTITAVRHRKNITGIYNLTVDDQGYEINCVGTFTVSLPTCPEFASRFVYIRNTGTGLITLDAGASYVIYGLGERYYYLGSGSCIQLQTNGVDWHVLSSTGYPSLIATQDVAAVASAVITGLNPSIKYRLVYELTNYTAVNDLYMRFNEDSGNHYFYTLAAFLGGSALTTYTSNLVTSQIKLGHQTTIGSKMWGEIEFKTLYGDDTFVRVYGNSYYDNAGSYFTGLVSGHFTDGAASIVSVSLVSLAGTFTGRIWLYQVG